MTARVRYRIALVLVLALLVASVVGSPLVASPRPSSGPAAAPSARVPEALSGSVGTFAPASERPAVLVPQVIGGCPPVCNTTTFAYNLTFEESGLANGQTWSVTVNWSGGIATTASNVTAAGLGTIEFAADPNTYTFQVSAVPGYLVSPSSGTVTVGSSDTLVDVFYTLPLYNVSFVETGLPDEVAWSMLLEGLAGTNLTDNLEVPAGAVNYTVSNGTYDYSVGLVPAGPGFAYSPSPANGAVSVSGGPVVVPLSFTLVPTFLITFREQKLPIGATWSVAAWAQTETNTTAQAGTTTSSKGTIVEAVPAGVLVFAIPNVSPVGGGTYGVAKIGGPGGPNQTAGMVTGNATWTVTFGLLEPLFFNQSLLPQYELYPGAGWSVRLVPALSHGGPAPETASSGGASIGFFVPAGAAYRFQVSGPSLWYKIAPALGSVHVPAGPFTKFVKFLLLTEVVVFKPSGLQAGQSWTVTLETSTSPALAAPLSLTKLAGTGAIRFKLPVGTYSFSITVTDAQVVSPSAGSVTVATAPSPAQTILVTFS